MNSDFGDIKDRQDYQYNDLKTIADIRHEVIHDKT